MGHIAGMMTHKQRTTAMSLEQLDGTFKKKLVHSIRRLSQRLHWIAISMWAVAFCMALIPLLTQ